MSPKFNKWHFKKISGMCLLYYLNLNIVIDLSLELYEEIKNNFIKFECSLIYSAPHI